MGEHTELLVVVGALNGIHLVVTAGRTHAAAAPTHSWRHLYGLAAASDLDVHAAARPW